MEGEPKQPEAISIIDESLNLSESIDRAHKLYDQLKQYEGMDIVGTEARAEVEAIALELTAALKGIPASIRLQEQLPYHPHEGLLAEEVMPLAA